MLKVEPPKTKEELKKFVDEFGEFLARGLGADFVMLSVHVKDPDISSGRFMYTPDIPKEELIRHFTKTMELNVTLLKYFVGAKGHLTVNEDDEQKPEEKDGSGN